MAATDLWVAKMGPGGSATFDYLGAPVVIIPGVTIVREGHPILDAHGDLFVPLTVHWDWDPPPDVKAAKPKADEEPAKAAAASRSPEPPERPAPRGRPGGRP